MKVRAVQKKDVRAIVELIKRHAQYEKGIFKAENKEALLTKHFFKKLSPVKCLVVEVEAQVVGYATFSKQFSTWDADYYVYLDCLFLKEEVRGGGVGKQIMEHIKAYAKSEYCSIVQWQTPIFNEKGINFYKKIGAEAKTKERFRWCV